ncbi:S41 family peptidase [Marinomonas mediterranea]|uniref:Carboxyl-terminal protease n=1 Tax=Marinomonas mediterranea (strain ATCC 700492 / JCM 21426 / NBRC 103028 / MMB-1) TaxID=717774 RepID=F2JUD2_MARM1|nr:S41 family peptidase [Marinomonas mediterranea]ADZ92751.1 carboxyl-terminal protease [Marinomonas mediterranea MMB-1]WCN10680.1 PDZ domain-containing protein [Marinomonas mediterranea]WCN14737.1 PDZ domain-containing protein [Marinomonas mediterranea]WCN18778.1 PDZ domain-containing protein [Marinomonas mediterranea MMB-1]
MRIINNILCGVALVLTVTPSMAEEKSSIPLEEIQSFVETFETIREGYVEDLDDRAILDKALKGMVAALDPHSNYLTSEEMKEFEKVTSGNYAGIGVEVEMADNVLTIVTPIDGSPAKEAGLEPGDVVVRIDSQLVSGMSLQDVTILMRGEVGTSVRLDVERDGQIKEYEIERRLIDESSITSKWLDKDDGIAYIRLSQFQGDSGEEFASAIKQLKQDQPIEGVILDLRNNPGGVLQSAVSIVDSLVDNGMIVYTDGRHQLSKTEFKASKRATVLPDAPVVVMINEGSASASEVVAGALQDHKRAVILGTESFGKGTVQTVVPLTNGAAVKLTTALYFTPKGRSIQAQGIRPDIIIPQADITVPDDAFFIKEAELKGHISNGTGGEERTSSDVQSGLSQLAASDFQLFQALTILQSVPKLTKKL